MNYLEEGRIYLEIRKKIIRKKKKKTSFRRNYGSGRFPMEIPMELSHRPFPRNSLHKRALPIRTDRHSLPRESTRQVPTTLSHPRCARWFPTAHFPRTTRTPFPSGILTLCPRGSHGRVHGFSHGSFPRKHSELSHGKFPWNSHGLSHDRSHVLYRPDLLGKKNPTFIKRYRSGYDVLMRRCYEERHRGNHCQRSG